MSTTKAEVLQALWMLAPVDADDGARVLVNPTELAARLGCAAEEAGQALTDLGCGRTRLRLPNGQRVYQRTFRVADLPPIQPAGTPAQIDRQTPETPPAETRLPAGILPHGFPIEPNCSRCYEPLPSYMRALGICGDCLTASQQEVRSVPGARYGCVGAIRGQEPASMYYVPGPGYSRRE